MPVNLGAVAGSNSRKRDLVATPRCEQNAGNRELALQKFARLVLSREWGNGLGRGRAPAALLLLLRPPAPCLRASAALP